MTVLQNNVIPPRSPLSLKNLSSSDSGDQLKRKCTFKDSANRPKKPMLGEMLNGYRADHPRGSGGDAAQDSPVATLSNMGNTCFLNSVLYTLRFAPTFLHNLHHLIGDLSHVSARITQHKAKTSSLGRNVGAITGPSARSTSSKDLLSLGNSSNDVIPKSKVQIVTEKLHDLFITMHNLEMKESTEPYQPLALLQAVRDANYIFEGHHQQDAHELLVYLLDNIRDTCDVLMQQVQQNPDWLLGVDTSSEQAPSSGGGGGSNSKLWSVRRSWKKSHGGGKKKDKAGTMGKEGGGISNGPLFSAAISEELQNGASATDTDDACSVESGSCETTTSSAISRKRMAYNFVAEDFEGITLRRTKCLECESVTERKEPFYDIPVPIPTNEADFEGEPLTASDIYRRACVTSEKLCDSNKYLCERCSRYNEASREVLFEKLPNIMVLQLKRFTTTTAGVQKVNTYMPTPLELECFCETCCTVEENEAPPHRYRLCCVIMHLGGSMASGHYIAYVRASDHLEDYAECSRNLPKGSLSASSSEKSLNILKYFKPRNLSNPDNSRSNMSKNVVNGVRMCKSMDCCGVKLNKNVMENVVNLCKKGTDYPSTADDMWLECDDENVKPISSQELEDELSPRPNSTSTPYLLFYAKMTDLPID